jgi:hypothetical protein
MKSHDLEYCLLYSMVVAGKSASFADKAMQRVFSACPREESPFEFVADLARGGQLEQHLRTCRTGNYTKLARGFAAAAGAGLNLRRCTPADLEAIHGVGPKTSRFFIIWTRPKANHAALDTHVLKWLRFIGHKAPLSTPSGRKYALLEVVILTEAKKRGMTARELDSAIWDWCSTGGHLKGEWPEILQPLNK